MDPSTAPIVLFDGVCVLCNASVDFILRFEKKPHLKFLSIQSEVAGEFLSRFKAIKITDSVLLIEDNRLYQESDAALRIAKKLKYFWLLYYLIYLPHWLRDPVYRWVASNRYHWFGKRSECRIPEKEIADRFI